MDGHIDWLSWTLPAKIEPRSVAELYQMSKHKLWQIDERIERIIYDGQLIDAAGSRTPYRLALARDDNGFRCYGNSRTETILHELTGTGCEPLRDEHLARVFAAGLCEHLTRLDYAIDIRTETKPSVFANERDSERFRSVSFIRSETGETVYIGSPKSDRFARVYRYNPPHPRAHLLRIEIVFRRKLAKHAAKQLLETESQQDFIAQIGNTWGFAHDDWQPEVITDEKLKAPVASKRNQDTVSWLYTQVAPAVRRLMDENELDFADWLQYIYGTGRYSESE
mgnify:CR=1 FL=1